MSSYPVHTTEAPSRFSEIGAAGMSDQVPAASSEAVAPVAWVGVETGGIVVIAVSERGRVTTAIVPTANTMSTAAARTLRRTRRVRRRTPGTRRTRNRTSRVRVARAVVIRKTFE